MAEACVSFVSVPFESLWPPALKAAVYTCGMLYCFLGLGLIAQQYMSAMDNIVKQTRTVTCKDGDSGVVVVKEEKIWNPTIADITLLALGTSAPPISLAIISAFQQLGKPSTGADVGTGTMLGGAAFNFFGILAACILIPRQGSIKRVANFGVFLVELIWSIWAYVWLFIVFSVWTPGRITLVEAILTVLHMPVLMLHAYAQDQQWPLVSLANSWHADKLPRHEGGEAPEGSDALDTLLATKSSEELYGAFSRDHDASLAQPGALALSTSVATGILALSPNSLALATSTGRTSSSRGGAAAGGHSRGSSLDIEKAVRASEQEDWGRGRVYDSVAHLVSPVSSRGPLCLFPLGEHQGIREEAGEIYGDGMVNVSSSMYSARDNDGQNSSAEGGSDLPLVGRTLSEGAGKSGLEQGWVPNPNNRSSRPNMMIEVAQGSPEKQAWGLSDGGLRHWPQLVGAQQSSDAPQDLVAVGQERGIGVQIQRNSGTEAAWMLEARDAREVAESALSGLKLDLSTGASPWSPERLADPSVGFPDSLAGTCISPSSSSTHGNVLLRDPVLCRAGQRSSRVHLVRKTGSNAGPSGDVGGAALCGSGEQDRSDRQMGPDRTASSPPWTLERIGAPGGVPPLLSLHSLSKDGVRRRSFIERGEDRALEGTTDRGRDGVREREGEREREDERAVPCAPEREALAVGTTGQVVLTQGEGRLRLSRPTEVPSAGITDREWRQIKDEKWEKEEGWEGEGGGDREPTARLLVIPDRAGLPLGLHAPYGTLTVHPRHTASLAQALSPQGSRNVEPGMGALSQASLGELLGGSPQGAPWGVSLGRLGSWAPDRRSEGHAKQGEHLGLPDRHSNVNQSKYRERGARSGGWLAVCGGGVSPALRQQCQQMWVLCCYAWRLLFAAVVPPPDSLHGWPAFLVSIGVISGVSMVVIELANLLGCVTGVDSFIISMTVLASGTSIPNVIASAIAAQQSPHADSAIANVNASNSINVYLGLGLPWVITSTYDILVLKRDYTIDASTLGPSLLVYFGTIGVGLAILFGRRWIGGGELGGNRTWALASAACLIGLWVVYCVLSLSLFYHVL